MEHPKKILYISHSGELQGAGIALINIIKGVTVTHEYEPIVVMPQEGVMSEILTRLGVRCYIIPYYNEIIPYLESFRQYLFFLPKILLCLISNVMAKKKLKKIIIQEAPVLIHTNSGVIHIGYRVAKELKIPHVWHLREIQGKQTRYCPLYGLTEFKDELQDGNICISISNAVKDYYNIRTFNEVIYDGVFSKSAFVKPNCNYEGPPYFLYVGGLQQSKGFFDALEAFNVVACNNRNCELWLAGVDNVGFNRIISNHPYMNRIKYLGIRSDILQLMANSLAVLVLGYNEGFGFTLVETILSKSVAIARNQAGLKEQMDNAKIELGGELALRFNNNDELAKQMESVLSNNFVLAEKEVSFNYVYEHYSLERNIEKLLKLYQTTSLHEHI